MGSAGLLYNSIAEHKQLIDDHNAKHELGVHHNKVHKVSITEVINW